MPAWISLGKHWKLYLDGKIGEEYRKRGFRRLEKACGVFYAYHYIKMCICTKIVMAIESE